MKWPSKFWGLHKRLGISVVIFSVFAALVMVLSGIPFVASVTPIVGTSVERNAGIDTSPLASSSGVTHGISVKGDGNDVLQQVPNPQGLVCDVSFASGNILLGALEGCFASSTSGSTASNAPNENVAAENVMIYLNDSLNATNAETAIINATFQELLAYYESRAEAIVPYFLNMTTWNSSLYAQIAIDSGLVPSIEGVETAFAGQQYQDWNATASSWNAAFGSSGDFTPDDCAAGWWEFDRVCPTFAYSGASPGDTNVFGPLAYSGMNLAVTQPFESWDPIGHTPTDDFFNITYFNMEYGGTIVNANTDNLTDYTDGAANYTVKDVTTGTSFYVPYINYTNWVSGNIPQESHVHHIGQFDLLKLVCNANCSQGTGSDVETSGAFAFANRTTKYPLGTVGTNEFFPQLTVYSPGFTYFALRVPSPANVCIDIDEENEMITCSTTVVPTGGNSTSLGSGAGAVVAGNRTLYAFAQTAQSLVNNTMLMAYDYWVTLKAITLNGTFSIPANCAIPTPSDAFPESTNYLNYNLSADNIEAVYLAYLNAIAREYGQVFTTYTGFCGDPNLGFSFNWTQDWKLALNITASVYVTNNSAPVYLNGTPDHDATYSDVASWPVYNINPTLLYPYEYQMNVPVNTIYPVPINDPLVGVLVNYKGNLEYGNPVFSPAWGIPTYVSLIGNGNYINISGNLTNTPSGNVPSEGAAISISSCVLNGIIQTHTCDISVTYFNAFAIGPQHAVLPPQPFPPTPCGIYCQQAQLLCGTGAMNQWYDAWAGTIVTAGASIFIYIGEAANNIPKIGGAIDSFFTDLGCIVGYVLLVIILVFIAWLVIYIIRIIRG
jgi:hypothetical protein